jgi:hypothetical protein
VTFTPLSRLVWSLGNPDAPELSFNGVDDAGVKWVCEDPVGWNGLAPELEVEQAAADGGFYGHGRWPSRVLTIRGAFRGCGGHEVLDAAEERLRDAVEHVTTDQLLSVTETVPKQVTVRLTGECLVDPVKRNPQVRTFSFVLTAADPYKYAAGAGGLVTVGPIKLAQPTGGSGLEFPAATPLDFGTTRAVGNWRETVNRGRVPAFPVTTITGPALRPRLRNVTTGQVIGLGVSLGAGQEAVIDHARRTVRIGGASRNRARTVESTFWALARRRNEVRFEADDYSPDAEASLTYRPRWR